MGESLEIQVDANQGAAISAKPIEPVIHVIRGIQVIVDSDLADLYQVETKNLNRTAKRNEDRFPEDFRFQLTEDEWENLRCQIGTANSEWASAMRRTPPYAYTEQGIAMLSGLLRSEVATKTSIAIMRAFVEMRRFLAGHAELLQRVRTIEFSQWENQRSNEEKFTRIFDYIESAEPPRQKIFFEGQVYDALSLLSNLVRSAQKEIVLVDGYVDLGTLDILAKKREGVRIELYASNRSKVSERDIELFNAQYPSITVRHTTIFHDRFLIIDGKVGYHVGASLKDAGKRGFAINRLEDARLTASILQQLRSSHQIQVFA